MDRRFSIADANEGLTRVQIDANELVVTPEQWNEVVGETGVMSFGRRMRSNLVRSVNYDDNGGEYSFDGKVFTVNGAPTFQVVCPNVYIFCLSQKHVAPQRIDREYDSQYFIDEANLSDFAANIASKLLETFSAAQIDSDRAGRFSLRA